MSKMKKYIYLPAIEKHVTLKQYIEGIKLAKLNPDSIFKHSLTCWWPCTGTEIMKQFREGIQERINQCIPYILRDMEKYGMSKMKKSYVVGPYNCPARRNRVCLWGRNVTWWLGQNVCFLTTNYEKRNDNYDYKNKKKG